MLKYGSRPLSDFRGGQFEMNNETPLLYFVEKGLVHDFEKKMISGSVTWHFSLKKKGPWSVLGMKRW